ncbi:hypothetical protein Trydic_g20484 [Trypoxylus dichotomus]
MGKFDPSKTSSREEYASSRFSVAQHLTPPLPEKKPTYRSNHAHVNRTPPPPPFRPNRRYNDEYRQTNNNRSTSRNGNISSHVSKPTHLEENDVAKERTAYPAEMNAIQVVEADVHCEPEIFHHNKLSKLIMSELTSTTSLYLFIIYLLLHDFNVETIKRIR